MDGEAILIDLSTAMQPRIEVLPYCLDIADENIFGEKPIECMTELGDILDDVGIKRKHLAASMDAGVGSTRAFDRRLFS